MDIGIEKQKLAPIKSLLSESWKKYVNRFGDLAWIALPAALAVAIGNYLTKLGGSFQVVGGVVTAVSVIVAILSTIALIYAVRNEKQFDESYSYAARNILSYLWVTLLALLTGMGGILVGVIPALIFAVWFSLVGYIFVSEGDRGLAVLLKNKEYVRGYFWPVTWRLLVAILASLLVGLVAGTAGVIFGLIGAVVVSSIVSQIILAPFLVVYLYGIYQDLTRVKPELAGAKVEKNRKFFTFASIWGVAASIIIFILLVL